MRFCCAQPETGNRMWVVYIGLFAVRTVLEDRTLQAELPGYREYLRITRYRLLPHLW